MITHAVLSLSSGSHRFHDDFTVTTSNTSSLEVSDGASLSVDKLSIRGTVTVGGVLTVHSIEAMLHVESFTVTSRGAVVFASPLDLTNGPINIGSLTIATSQYFQLDHPAVIKQLHLQKGVLSGSATFDVDQLLWQGGTLTGMRQSQVLVRESFNLIESDIKYLNGRKLVVHGKGVWTGGGTLSANDGAVLELGASSEIRVESNVLLKTQRGATMYNFGQIEHNPVIELPGFLTINANFYNYGLIKALGQGGLVIQNSLQSFNIVEVASRSSTIRVESGDHLFARAGQLHGHGSLVVTNGRIRLGGVRTDVSIIQIAAGTVEIYQKEHTVVALQELQLEGSGSRFESSTTMTIEKLELLNGVASFARATNISHANVSSGTLLSQETTRIGNLVWRGGYMAGSGRLESLSTMIIYSTVRHYISASSTVSLVGETTMMGPLVDILLYRGAQLINEANGSLLLIDSNGIVESSTGVGSFINHGFVRVVASERAATEFSLRFINNGRVQVKQETLRLPKSVVHRGQLEIFPSCSSCSSIR